MGENYEIDYPAILAGMKKMFDERMQTESEYFELLKFISENGNEKTQCLSAVMNNIMNMDMSDQVIFLRSYKNLVVVCNTLQTKYNFEIPEEEDEDDGCF